MTTAPTYNRLYNFTNFQTSNPATPLPANQVDAELSQIKVTLDALIANAAIIQRSDGPLANASVGLVQLDSTVPISFSPPNAWQVGNIYAIGNTTFLSQKLYVCLVANTATVGNTPSNLAPTWALLADFSTITIPPGSLNTVSFANQSVTTAILADANVTTGKIANQAITTALLADANVTTAKIATAAITAALMGFSINAVQHRLTFSTGAPILSFTVAAATSVFCTPYVGNLLPLWNGSIFVATASAEISNLLSDATKNPAAAVANSVYDIFAWNDAGTVRLSRGPVWSSATARSAGTALGRVNGLLVNSVSVTNGPGAGFGTYMGTILTDAGGATVSWSLGGSASGGTPATLNLWNMYNRVNVSPTVTDSGTSYTYTTGTIRQARASAGNQIGFVVGQGEDGVQFAYNAKTATAAAGGALAAWGCGFDTTTVFSNARIFVTSIGANLTSGGAVNSGVWAPSAGAHVLSMNELGDGVNANTFDNASTNVLTALIRC